MGDSKVKKIIIDKNGPYIVSGDIPLTVEIISNNKDGFSWDWKQGKKFETKSAVLIAFYLSLAKLCANTFRRSVLAKGG